MLPRRRAAGGTENAGEDPPIHASDLPFAPQNICYHGVRASARSSWSLVAKTPSFAIEINVESIRLANRADALFLWPAVKRAACGPSLWDHPHRCRGRRYPWHNVSKAETGHVFGASWRLRSTRRLALPDHPVPSRQSARGARREWTLPHPAWNRVALTGKTWGRPPVLGTNGQGPDIRHASISHSHLSEFYTRCRHILTNV